MFTVALLEHQDFLPTRDAEVNNTFFANTELTVSIQTNPEQEFCPHQIPQIIQTSSY